MIKVWFGYDKDASRNPDVDFKNIYEPEWFNNDIVKRMVKDIDSSEVVSPYCINSPVLGQIAPSFLSGGVKSLIMLLYLDYYYLDLVSLGENCCYWLSEICKVKDIRVSMSGYNLIFEGCDIQGICENDNSKINSRLDWIYKMDRMVSDYRR